MIISRYLIKEVAHTLLAVTFVLLLIFLSQQLVRYLGYAASGKIPANILLQLLGFQIPFLLAILLPLGLYLGIILAYGRLYVDNEMRVLQACGFSPGRLISITSILAILVTIIVMSLTLWINPGIAAKKDQLLKRGTEAETLLNTLMPGRFQVSNNGRRVIYVEKISRNHKQAENIFIAEEKESESNENNIWTVLSASRGFQEKDKITHDRFIVAADGYRYEGIPGNNDYKIIEFKKYAVRAPELDLRTRKEDQEALSTLYLFKNYSNYDNAAELQWRISIPLSTFLLALLAVRLSRVKPRQGRYSALFFAILIYIVYMNLLFAARNMVEQHLLSNIIGMWWVHIFILGFIIILFINRPINWHFWRRS